MLFTRALLSLALLTAVSVQGLPQAPSGASQAAPPMPSSMACQASQQSYTVKSGDNCNTIADQFKTTAQAIIQANQGVNAGCTNLKEGQTLCIPAGSGGASGASPAPTGGSGTSPAPAGGSGTPPAPAGGSSTTPAPAGGSGIPSAPAGGSGASTAPTDGGAQPSPSSGGMRNSADQAGTDGGQSN